MRPTISKAYFIFGASILLGFISLGAFIKSSVLSLKSFERVVNVKGLAEREVEANRVIWPIVYKEIGDNLFELHEKIKSKNRTIISYLNSKGLTEEEITISAPSIIDMSAERYQSQLPSYRYNITSVITVSSEKVKLVRAIITSQSELLAKGVALLSGEYQYQTQYLFTNLNEIKPEMIEEATKNGRAAAEKFAFDSKSKLGKIKRASQGQFSIENRDANTPHIKQIRVVSTIEYMLRD